MKRLIRKIEEYIAIRFLNRELDKDYAGKVLPIAYSKLIKYAIEEGCLNPEVNYNFKLKEQEWRVNCKITLGKLEPI